MPDQQDDDAISMNQLPDPATFVSGSLEHFHRPKKQRIAEEAHAHLNINSLLDVLSVILVFLMKSYSANTVQVKPSIDLKLPFSHSLQVAQESTAITITLKNILVDDMPVLNLEHGVLTDKAHNTEGLLIKPLFTKMQEVVEHQKKVAQYNKKAEFKGLLTIIADRDVPYLLLTEVMYTAGLAEFSTFKFATIKSER